MYIVHLTSEISPIAKVGGLADVTAGLSKTLIQEGVKVNVILPFYNHIDRKKLINLKVELHDLTSYINMNICQNTIYSAEINGVPLVLIDPQNDYFKRGAIYGENDDDIRFMYFTKIALDYLLKTDKHPDVLHLHDWLTSLAAPLYHEVYKPLGLKIGGIMTNIHNMQYQGVCSLQNFSYLGIHSEKLINQKNLKHDQKDGKINLLKGALFYSDSLITVSPSYANDIKGKEGFGLGPLIREKKEKLKGILNGIDTTYWNPETDPFIKENYLPKLISLEELKSAKKINRKELSKILSINYDSTPLFTCITRLVKQKGPEMIRFGIEYILQKGGQFVLLGSTPENDVKQDFFALAKKYQDHPNVHFQFKFDEKLAHLIYSSADCILIPSLFEPCGLTQMIALRYGTIPIVHNIGGLKDTIFDIDQNEHPFEVRNGYTFDNPSNEGLRYSIDRAFDHLLNDPNKWAQMIKNGFNRDWSWKIPTFKYLKIYQSF